MVSMLAVCKFMTWYTPSSDAILCFKLILGRKSIRISHGIRVSTDRATTPQTPHDNNNNNNRQTNTASTLIKRGIWHSCMRGMWNTYSGICLHVWTVEYIQWNVEYIQWNMEYIQWNIPTCVDCSQCRGAWTACTGRDDASSLARDGEMLSVHGS